MKNLFRLLFLALAFGPGFAWAQGTPPPIQIFAIYPDYGLAGQTLDVVVAGTGTHFDQASSALSVDFGAVSGPTFATGVNRLNDTTLLVSLAIPAGTPVGNYDVTLYTRSDGNPVLLDGFRVVTSAPSLPPGSISGVVFNDKNKNCTQSTGENGFARRVVMAMPGPYYTVTNPNGAYTLRVPYGTYNVNRLADEFFDPLCQLNGLTTAVSSAAPTATGRNFADTSYNCSVDLQLLGTNLPAQRCNYAAAAVKYVVTGRPARRVMYEYLTEYWDNGTPVNVWIPYYYGYNDFTSTALRDTIYHTMQYQGSFRVIAQTEGGCADTMYFQITQNVPPLPQCSVYLEVPDTATFYPGCMPGRYGPNNTGFTAYYGYNECGYANQVGVTVIALNADGSTRYSYSVPSYRPIEYDQPGKYKIVVGDTTTTCNTFKILTVVQAPCQWSINTEVTISGSTAKLSVVAYNNSCLGATLTLRLAGSSQIVYQETIPYYANHWEIPNLGSGTYDITIVRGDNACTGTKSVTINVPVSYWPITFGNTSDDFVRGLVRDASGNVYASLSFRGTISLGGTTLVSASTTRRDAALAKFTTDGALLWVRQIGNGTFDMEPRGVNIDGSGNPFWAGSFAGTIAFNPGSASGVTLVAAGSYDAFVARLDPTTGNCVWAKRVGGSGNDYLYGCFVSNSGNVYAGGSYTGTIQFAVGTSAVSLPNAGGLDGFIVKFDASGNGIYASRMGSTDNDEVKSIEYNGGDLVACGYMGNNCVFPAGTNAAPSTTTLASINGSRDGWAARINSEGRCVWVKNFGTIYNDEAQSICLDPSTGNVFTAAQVADAPLTFNGLTYPGYGNNDIAVVGWNFYTQAPMWAKRVGSSTGDVPASIRWDGTRLVVAGHAGGSFSAATGITLSSNGGQDAVVLRYNKSTGAVTSGQFIGGAGNDQAQALWVNTTTREELVGGVFSQTVNFPDLDGPSVLRTSSGGFDGFIARISVASGAREGDNEPSLNRIEAGLKVWPQPVRAGNLLTVGSEQASSATLLDMQGRTLQAFHLSTGENRLQMPQTPGIYILRSEAGIQKIVVE